MNIRQITTALSLVLLFAAPVHARGGWDGNGVSASGVAPGVLPTGSVQVKVQTVELPEPVKP